MVKNPFWYKRYKHINWLQASINCSMWVAYWRLLNRFSGGLLNNLIMLGLHHWCLPDNFRKMFQNTGRLLLTFKFIKFWFRKKENYCNVGIPPLFFRNIFPESPESFSVFKNINSDFYTLKVFATSRYLSRESFPSVL